MYNAETQHTVEWEKKAEGQRNFFMFKFSLTCLRI